MFLQLCQYDGEPMINTLQMVFLQIIPRTIVTRPGLLWMLIQMMPEYEWFVDLEEHISV